MHDNILLCFTMTLNKYFSPKVFLHVWSKHPNCFILFLFYDPQEGWAAALQTLELTLDEVVHIRSVLTKAELENLPLEGTLKEDVEKGKVRPVIIFGSCSVL